MSEIKVERTIATPADRVFEVIADHANYKRFRGIRRSELVRHGRSEPNGVGALRRIDIGPLRFEEEITAFERPTRMDYLIVKLNAPFEHHGGSIRLEPTADGTHAVWTSSFEIPVAVVGGLAGRITASTLAWGFAGVLEKTDQLLRRPSPGQKRPTARA